MVGVTGIEPVTSSLSGTRSNQLSYTPRENLEFRRQKAEVLYPPFHPSSFILHPSYFILRFGGGSRGRTGDIQLAKLALYQLSYAPGLKVVGLLCLGRL